MKMENEFSCGDQKVNLYYDDRHIQVWQNGVFLTAFFLTESTEAFFKYVDMVNEFENLGGLL